MAKKNARKNANMDSPSERDLSERKTTMQLFIMIAVAILGITLLVIFVVAPAMSVQLSPGMGIREAALIAFVVTLIVVVVMMVAAGDGLIGEIQFTLPAFFVFFVLIWILIAWVF